MIAIDKVLVTDLLVEEQFVCDLHSCKGGCCEDGEAGAPLQKDEVKILDAIYEKVKPYLTPEGIEEIERQGRYQYNKEFGWVTPTIEGKMCAYGFKDKRGIINCGIEHAYNDGKVNWKKPISCHLFPAKTKKSRNSDVTFVNYEPREDLCQAACGLGKKLKVPVYIFLKEALIRKFGEEFYETLEATAKHLETTK